MKRVLATVLSLLMFCMALPFTALAAAPVTGSEITIPVGDYPVQSVLEPGKDRLWVVNNYSNSISVIDLETHTVEQTIPVGYFPSGIAFANGKVYVANEGFNTVSVISLETLAVTSTISGFRAPAEIAATADGDTLYVTDYHGSSVSVVDTGTDSITGTIEVGGLSCWCCSRPCG